MNTPIYLYNPHKIRETHARTHKYINMFYFPLRLTENKIVRSGRAMPILTCVLCMPARGTYDSEKIISVWLSYDVGTFISEHSLYLSFKGYPEKFQCSERL